MSVDVECGEIAPVVIEPRIEVTHRWRIFMSLLDMINELLPLNTFSVARRKRSVGMTLHILRLKQS